MTTLTFTVLGKPVPLERARLGKRGKWYTPPASREYRERIAWAAMRAKIAAKLKDMADFRGPVSVRILVVMPDRRRRDLDNIAKAVNDALTGVLWRDDSQVESLTITREVSKRPQLEVTVEPGRNVLGVKHE